MSFDIFRKKEGSEISVDEARRRLRDVERRIEELKMKWTSLVRLRSIVTEGKGASDDAVNDLWEWIGLENDRRRFNEVIARKGERS